MDPAPHPVLVAGVDGSEASLAAVREAIAMAQAGSGHVIAVHVAAGAPSHLHPAAQALLERDGEAEGHSALLRVPLGVEARLERGAPAERLLAVARETGADAVVVGSHGLGAAGGPLGGVCADLLEISELPVIVLPPRSVARAGHGR